MSTDAPSRLSAILPARTEIVRLLQRPRAFLRAYCWPLVILIIGATADVITTYRNLQLYGPSVEAHPVQRWVSELVGVELGVPIAKLIQLVFVLLVAAWWKPWTPWMLSACGLLYATASLSNYFLWL